ncbi:hypothetical protein [Rickettsia conorii]|uniref:hypothetical protein n=1 Tax=Rickettsia conorii TaxID=781 RepID=UPI00398A7911
MSVIPNSALPAWIPSRHCERLQGAWQSSKNNKNLNISIFNWIASSRLAVFPRNDWGF